uniref:Acylglycerol kinase C-terminal domain-containing protein n=1 Tax=Micrurus surinamensis TaxID=129470 RepID=A0A2D4PJD7_MICSU
MKDPHLCPEGSQCLQASKCVLQLPENTEGSLAIDNEEHEAMTVEVKLLPRKLHFFCDARRKVKCFKHPSLLSTTRIINDQHDVNAINFQEVHEKATVALRIQAHSTGMVSGQCLVLAG